MMYIFYTEKHCWFVILIICVSAFITTQHNIAVVKTVFEN